MGICRNVKLLILISLFSQLLSNCVDNNKPEEKIGDGGILSGQPCSAPCFWDITPGVTTIQQATDILSSKLGLSNCDQLDTRNNGGSRGMQCSNITVDFDDKDLISGIGFSPANNITVDEIIKKYGNPDGVFIARHGIEMIPRLSCCFTITKRI
jgi:hypothetical protein